MDHKNRNNFLAGFLFFLIPAYSFLTWIYVFNTNPDHPTRVEKYEKFFLGIFQGPLLHGIAILASAALAIWFLSRVHNLSTPAAILKYGLIVITCFLIMFNIWGLL